MNREHIIIWGTGNVASKIFDECLTLNQYDIFALIDNDVNKWGKYFYGIEIHSPEYLFDNIEMIDKIVILTDSFDEVKHQITRNNPGIEKIIENKYYFYKRSIIERYSCNQDLEIQRILAHLNKHPLDVFNYDFVNNYNDKTDVFKDDFSGLYYVLHHGKKLYFSEKYTDETSVRRYYKSICIEQDINSPHRYLTKGFDINPGSVVIDAGVAEGNFSLEIIDRVKKIYLIEADPMWVKALRYTFKPYEDKITIITKYVTSYCEGDFATIDSMISDKVDFIKMDIEGYEWDALQGAVRVINDSENIKIAACCYHSDFDQILIEDFFDKNGIDHSTTKGYMWFPSTCRQAMVSTRLNRGIVRGIGKK